MLDEKDVLDEVRAGPAGGGAGLHTHGPGDVAVGDHLLDQGVEFSPGRWDGVAEEVEVGRAVPDDGLDVGFDGYAEPLAVDGAHGLPEVGVVGGVGAEGGEVLEFVGVEGEWGCGRPEDDVGWGGFGLGVKDGSISSGLGDDLDAAGVDEGLEDGVEFLLLGARPLIEHGHLVACRCAHAVDRWRWRRLGGLRRSCRLRYVRWGNGGFGCCTACSEYHTGDDE